MIQLIIFKSNLLKNIWKKNYVKFKIYIDDLETNKLQKKLFNNCKCSIYSINNLNVYV